jgi:toxin ParE1/3/4
VSPTVSKTPQAFHDLDTIADFIGLDNPQAGLRFLDVLEGKFQLLAESPGIGRLRPELAPELRAFPVEAYLVFYRQAPSGIEIVRVLHGARDIEAVFEDAAEQSSAS